MPASSAPKSKRVVRNTGLSEFARREKVDLSHAYRVVTGERSSNRLSAAWRRFKKERAA